jgi:MFS transporter, OFA family, oxalate/formate antiporter
MEEILVSKKHRFFYGYIILGAAFLLQLIVNGCGSYVFSLFVNPLQTDFGWSRGDIMFALIVYNLVMAAASPFVGRIVDRYGVKWLLAFGALTYGVGLIMLGFMSSLWQFNLLWGIIGIGNTAVGFIPTTALIFNWFKKRRGLAVGIMGAGVGAGGFIMSPVVGYLIPKMGWRDTYYILGIIMAAILIPLALFIFRSKPSDMGFNQDGVEDADVEKGNGKAVTGGHGVAHAKGIPEGGMTLKQTMTTTAFWLAVVGFLSFGFSQSAIFQNHAPHLRDVGFDAGVAAIAVSACGFGSTFGKFSFGLLCDWIKPKYTLIIGIGLEMIATFILMGINKDSPIALVYLYAVIYGFGVGCWLPSLSLITSTTFGLAYYGSVFGILNLVHQLGNSFGPYTAGVIFDSTGSYYWAFVAFQLAFALTIPLILLIKRPKWQN